MSEYQWPDRARRHLQGLQEAAYDELASLAGLSSRDEAYRVFVSDPLPPAEYQKWQDEFLHGFSWQVLNNKVRHFLAPSKIERFNMLERYRDWFFSTEMPTPYENPLLYPVLLQVVTSIKEGAARWGFQNIIPPSFLFGTLPTGSINACATPVPESEDFLVLFDFGLFQFTGEMAKVLARLIPAKLTLNEIKFNMGAALEAQYAVAQQPELITHFEEVLQRYLVEGNPQRFPKLQIDRKEQKLLAGALMDAARSFVLGHEMGHLLCHHVSAKAELRQMIGRVSIVEVSRSWQDEYEADHWGFNYEQTKRLGPEWALVGSSVFFSCWMAVERCLIALSYGRTDLENRGSATHPPAGQRYARLRSIVQQDTSPEYAGDILEWSNYIEALMGSLTERVCPSFRQMYLNGVRPFGQWART